MKFPPIIIIGLVVAAFAWINYAEHPTAKTLRKALIDTGEEVLTFM